MSFQARVASCPSSPTRLLFCGIWLVLTFISIMDHLRVPGSAGNISVLKQLLETLLSSQPAVGCPRFVAKRMRQVASWLTYLAHQEPVKHITSTIFAPLLLVKNYSGSDCFQASDLCTQIRQKNVILLFEQHVAGPAPLLCLLELHFIQDM